MSQDFKDWTSDVHGFSSKSSAVRQKQDCDCQTDEVVTEEKAFQSKYTAAVGTLTEETKDETADAIKLEEPYPPSLFAFFAKVTGPVCEYLEENANPLLNAAFNSLNFEDLEDDQEQKATKLHDLYSVSLPDQAVVSCVSWSKNGGQVAVGYGVLGHDGWCTHRVPVSIWNINRRVDDSSPHNELFMNSCVTALEFHPTDAALLAVGLHSGELSVIDIFLANQGMSGDGSGASKDVENFKLDGSGHNMSVTSIKWAKSPMSKNTTSKDLNTYRMVSGGKDGYICVWNVSSINASFNLEKRFIIWSDTISEEIKVGNRHLMGMKEIGITNMSFCKDDPTTVLFSTFGSLVFSGDMSSDIEHISSFEGQGDSEISVYDPKPTLIYKDSGRIVALDCSPYHRNLFLLANSDGKIVLSDISNPYGTSVEIYPRDSKPAQLTDIQWSSRPILFATIEGTTVVVYDLSKGQKPVLFISHETQLTKLSFSRKNLGVLAAGDVEGHLHIWKLPKSMSSHEPTDMEKLIELGKIREQNL